MLTSTEILAAVKDVAEGKTETKLEDFCGVSSDTLDEVISASNPAMDENEQIFFASGLIVALRAVYVKQND